MTELEGTYRGAEGQAAKALPAGINGPDSPALSSPEYPCMANVLEAAGGEGAPRDLDLSWRCKSPSPSPQCQTGVNKQTSL